jgi:hypothetical protein
VAHADQHVTPEETRAMDALVREQGQLSQDQAMVVVQLAKTSKLLFGGTANSLVAKEFSELATYDVECPPGPPAAEHLSASDARFDNPMRAHLTSRQSSPTLRWMLWSGPAAFQNPGRGVF